MKSCKECWKAQHDVDCFEELICPKSRRKRMTWDYCEYEGEDTLCSLVESGKTVVIFEDYVDDDGLKRGKATVQYMVDKDYRSISVKLSEEVWGGIAGKVCELLIESRDYERHIKKEEANG